MQNKEEKMPDNKKEIPTDASIRRAAEILIQACHGNAHNAGWHNNLVTGEPKPVHVPTSLMLIVTEVAEAMEGYRKSLNDDHLPHVSMLEAELADSVIRIFDLAGALGLDLSRTVVEKMSYNKTRADHKIENRQKPDGKKC